MTQIVTGLVRELVCVESQVPVRNSQPQIRGIHSKKVLSHRARTSHMKRLGQQRETRRERFAPMQSTSRIDPRRAAGAQRGSSTQRDLIGELNCPEATLHRQAHLHRQAQANKEGERGV